MIPFPESLYQLRSGLDLSDPAAQFGMVANQFGVSAAAGTLNLSIIDETTTGKLTVVTHATAKIRPGSAQRVRQAFLEVVDTNSQFIAQIDGQGSVPTIGDGTNGRVLLTLSVPIVIPAGFQLRAFAQFDASANANNIDGVSAIFYEIPAGTVRR